MLPAQLPRAQYGLDGVICNLTKDSLTRGGDFLEHGCWVRRPEQSIPPLGSGSFSLESCGAGIQGHVDYDGAGGQFRPIWNIPVIGSNDYRVDITRGPSGLAGWRARPPLGQGKHPAMTYVLYQSEPTDWMHANLSMLGNRTLRRLCMPGSHDAGMSEYGPHTATASGCNTKTQTYGIGDQLRFGSRFFDLRPVLSSSSFYTGHYSFVEKLSSFQGADGQSLAAIVDELNAFTANNAELVILNLSHDLDTDREPFAYRAFTQEQWDRCLLQLSGINHLYVLPARHRGDAVDLTTLTLDQFIGNGSPAVVIVVDPSRAGITLGKYANNGFYGTSSFPVYNSYSESNDVNVMSDDQLRKMRVQRANGAYFLLSWTLTQSDGQAATCPVTPDISIVDLANTANAVLYDRLPRACSTMAYPNIIYGDNVDTGALAALAMRINERFGA